MPGIDDIIMFGIKSAVKLARQGREAYVEATISRELILPLPNFNPTISLSAATAYFRGGGGVHLTESKRAKHLFKKAEANTTLDKDEQDELILIYKEFKLLDDVNSGLITGKEVGFSRDALLSLVTVRQWARDNSPFPSATQRVLGTLINVGVEYFATQPGIFDDRSTYGRALKGFLKSIDELNFAEAKVEEIAKVMFISAVETISEHADLLGADDKTSKLIEVVSKGLIQDVRQRLDALAGSDLSKRESIQDWAQLILRSVLSNAGETVLGNPQLYLALDDPGRQALISSVGTSVLDVILEEDAVDFSKLFSRNSLDKVVKASLSALAENPDLIGVDHKGIKKILAQLAKDLAKSTAILGVDLLPDVMRLVLEKTAQNAELLWPGNFKDPGKHLLITASKVLLQQLATPPRPGDSWKPKLSHSQIMDILDVTLDEVVGNPQWLIDLAADGSPLLSDLVKSVLGVLKKIPAERLSKETGIAIIKASIKAVGLRKGFMDKITVDGKQKKALVAILEITTDSLLSDNVDSKAQWTLARGQVVSLVVETVLTKLSAAGISGGILKKLQAILDEAVAALKANKAWSLNMLVGKIEKMAA